jgi:hypothetical protein
VSTPADLSVGAQRGPEYAEVNQYIRHYSSLRFVMVSVYFAVSAGIVSAGFRLLPASQAMPARTVLAFRCLGLGATACFMVYEKRLEELIRFYQRHARKLEGLLGYEAMKTRPQAKLMFGATWVLYGLFTVLWVASIVFSRWL